MDKTVYMILGIIFLIAGIILIPLGGYYLYLYSIIQMMATTVGGQEAAFTEEYGYDPGGLGESLQATANMYLGIGLGCLIPGIILVVLGIFFLVKMKGAE